ncbi:MAG: type IV secretory system conjugative DNA transfer family protein [Pseudomonadota bacterium]
MKQRDQEQPSPLSQLIIAAGSTYALTQLGPLIVADGTVNLPFALALAVLIGTAVPLSGATARKVSGWLDRWAAKIPGKAYGDAAWITRLRQYHKDVKRRGWAPYWGVLKDGKPVFAAYQSLALTVGPPGSSKSVSVVEPNALSILTSKIITDFKGSLSVKLFRTLRKRGEKVTILNLGGVFRDLLGASDHYNPLDLVADAFEAPGLLGDAIEDAIEMAFQLIPEKENANSDNEFFRDGARTFIAFGILINVRVEGRRAHLGMVLSMISDRSSLLRHAEWVAGRLVENAPEGGKTSEPRTIAFPIEDSPWIHLHDTEDILTFKEVLAGLARDVCDIIQDKETTFAESFSRGAVLALGPFKSTARASKVTRRSTFRFADLRERVGTVFLVADASRMESSKAVLGLIQWCALTELIRCPDHNRPVTLLADEATNFPVHNLPKLISWARGYGIRIHIIIQFLSAFKTVYGANGLDALLNASEIIQFLPGQTEKDTLSLIQSMLGERTIVTQSKSAGHGASDEGIHQTSYSETGRPLMTLDQIRREQKTFFFLRQHKPALVTMPPSSAIAPFRDQLAGDPFHGGKPWKKRVRLRLEGRDGPWPTRLLVRSLRRRRLCASDPQTLSDGHE